MWVFRNESNRLIFYGEVGRLSPFYIYEEGAEPILFFKKREGEFFMEKLVFNGVIREAKKDPRDYKISRFIPNQDVIENEAFCLPLPKKEIILNQKCYNSCVGHSFAMCKSILEYGRTKKWIDFDPYMIYGTRYEIDDYDGEGMYPKQGAKVLQKEGAFFRRDFKTEGEMPQIMWEVEKFKEKNPKLVTVAKNYRIDGYAFVYNITQIKTALMNGMPVSTAWPLYESFYKTGEDGVVPKPKTTREELIGYHQMTIVGWTSQNQWIVVNSWGTNKGMKGMYLIPFGYAFDSAIAVTDTIFPSLNKAKEIKLRIGSNFISVDGEAKEMDVSPIIRNSRTYIPIRSVVESLGASIEWIDSEKKVVIRSEEAEIVMKINNTSFLINGSNYNNDVAPIIVNNRTMLPIRAIAEQLNCEVEWEDATKTITIKAL